MIFSESRWPLFGIMLETASPRAIRVACPRVAIGTAFLHRGQHPVTEGSTSRGALDLWIMRGPAEQGNMAANGRPYLIDTGDNARERLASPFP